MRVSRAFVAGLYLVVASACSSSESPLSPATPGGSGLTIAAPALDTPADAARLSTLRPTLVVKNATGKGGTRLYEFQVSDKSDFSATASSSWAAFTVLAHQTNIPEGASGTTSYTPDFDLQPTTRLYWRARTLQDGFASDWSETRSFDAALVGYNRRANCTIRSPTVRRLASPSGRRRSSQVRGSSSTTGTRTSGISSPNHLQPASSPWRSRGFVRTVAVQK